MAHKIKPKQGKAIWMRAFPKQAKALRPERSAAGGVKARSQSKAVRDAVYHAIVELYQTAHPYCECCHLIFPLNDSGLHFGDDNHHVRGKDGLLYFDVRYFKTACRKAHNWIGANIEEARKLGLIAPAGKWNRIEP